MARPIATRCRWPPDVEDEQREEVVVPDRHHADQQHGHEARHHQRQGDAEEDPRLASAVDPGRVDELTGDRDVGVHLHQVDADRADHAGQDHAPDRVDQVRLGVGEVQRQRERGDRHQQGAEGQVEQHLRAAEREPGETVPGEGRQHRRAAAADHRVQRRVPEPLDVGAVAVHVLEQQREVVEEAERAGEPEAERLEDVRLGLGRVDDDPGDGDQREDREQEGERGQQGDRAAAQPVLPCSRAVAAPVPRS
jgi:hypothetical protein